MRGLILVALALALGRDRGEPADRSGTSADAGGSRPLVIAHRGASGLLPEHTLPAYALAHGLGADFIEPDVVMTRDGVMIALHDVTLEGTTDVERVFPDRRRDDGHWYAADLTLAEVRRLSAHERLEGRFRRDAGGFRIPTLREVIDLVRELNRLTGCGVGLYPEIKQPGAHRAAGLPLEEELLELLRARGAPGSSTRGDA